MRVVLINNFSYKGKLISLDDNSIVLADRVVGEMLISRREVRLIHLNNEKE